MEAIYTTYLIELEEGGDSSNCPAELQEFLQDAQRDENLEKWSIRQSFITYNV